MKPFGLYVFVISLASLAAAVQPSEQPAEAHAALAISGPAFASPQQIANDDAK